MAFRADTADIKWLVGADVDQARATMREIDQNYLMQILTHFFGRDRPMYTIGTAMQAICDEARAVVGGNNAFVPKISFGAPHPAPIFGFYADQHKVGPHYEEARKFAKILAKTNIYFNGNLINPLGIGDVNTFFVDMISSLKKANEASVTPIANFFASLQNTTAFNKGTNRFRVHRRNILEQGPNIGLVNWYLPPDDVLGAMDRMLGYYETADISASTTDALGNLAMLSTAVLTEQTRTIGPIDAAKPAVTNMINDGRAFAAFATIVAQMHHSLPESMMALNLIPPASVRVNDQSPTINRYYSPYLTNSPFAELGDLYTAWQTARSVGIKAQGKKDNYVYALFILQDVYQMPDRPTLEREVGFVIGLSMAENAATANDFVSSIFGPNAYNAFASGLNTPGPGPAPTLQRLSYRIMSNESNAPLFDGVFNPSLGAQPQRDRIADVVTKAMLLDPDNLANAANYRELIRPFVDQAAYGQVGLIEV
jgi:hypothetical protein